MMRAIIALTLAITSASTLGAQSTATLGGRVLDSTRSVIAGAAIVIENPVTGFRAQTVSDSDGGFSFRNIPFQTYSVTAMRPGFKQKQVAVSLRSNVPQTVELELEVVGRTESITVESSAAMLVDPEETGTR